MSARKETTTPSNDSSPEVDGMNETPKSSVHKEPLQDTNPLNRYHKDWSERMSTWRNLQKEYM